MSKTYIFLSLLFISFSLLAGFIWGSSKVETAYVTKPVPVTVYKHKEAFFNWGWRGLRNRNQGWIERRFFSRTVFLYIVELQSIIILKNRDIYI